MAQDQVEEVKNKTDIVAIIGERVDLKKAGRNFKSPCPFHSEKLPSFMVSPELQIYKCFGCGMGGDVFSFLKEYEGMDFGEALRYLAERAGIKLVYQKGEKSDRARLIEINDLVAKFYQYLLIKHPLGKNALSYVTKDRGISMETIHTFQIGYSPNESMVFSKFLVDKKKIAADDLEKLGLVYKRGRSVFDRFHGRVIFPLFDHRGNTVGFSGRLLPENDDGKSGKYINSPETLLYHKSDMLFGLNIARSEVKRSKEIILVEGELDMISMWQAGIKNVVATKGTAITESQALLIKRFADTVILALDTDLAGDAAARRGIQIAENAGLEVKVVRMKEYKDPDEAVRKDLAGFQKVLKTPVSIWDFLIDSIFERYDDATGSGKQKISKEVVPVLSAISDSIVKSHYLHLVAGRLGVPEHAVIEQMKKINQGEKHISISEPKKPEEKTRRMLLEERLFALAFSRDPNVLEEKDWSLIKQPLLNKIIDHYKSYLKNNKDYDLSEFGRSLPAELFEGFSNAILLEDSDVSREKEIDIVKKEIKILDVRKELNDMAGKISTMEKSGNKAELKKAEDCFKDLSSELSTLTKDD